MQRLPIDLSDVQAFLLVAKTGGFARAADRLGIDKSIVSRRVARLEEVLGTRLLSRGAGGAKLTELGAAYFAKAERSLAELESAGEVVAQALSEVAGPIRITVPVAFGVRHLASALADFAQRHPKVELDVSFDDRFVDLEKGGFDLAVRLGNLPDSSLVARRLSQSHLVLVGSPAYLAEHGTPRTPAEVAGHKALAYANAPAGDTWRFRDGDRWEHVRVSPRLRADNAEMLKAAVVAGLGLMIMPTFMIADEVERGELVVLLRDHPFDAISIWAVMPEGRGALARVRALVDFLVERFAGEPTWDPCWTKGREPAAQHPQDVAA